LCDLTLKTLNFDEQKSDERRSKSYEFSLDQGGTECWDELLQPY
jgi:hypothetical protein